MSAVADRSIRVAIAKDGISARLITAGVDPQLVTRPVIVSSLQELGIPITEEVMARIQKIDQDARTGQLSPEPILLVEGREPIPGSAATFELSPELAKAQLPENSEERSDFYRSQILTVEANTILGKLTAAVPPVPGLDVHGKPVQPPVSSYSMQLGKNVELGPDGTSVIATAAGKVHLTSCQVGIVPYVETPGDVDFSSGNIDSPSDVIVGGTIRDGFKVKSAASITVRGAIEAAEVETGTDLQVNGGIAARGQGKVIVGGELFTKFCTEADITSQGDITITKEALNSSIRCMGKLQITNGKLIGGRAYARDGATITQIGNDANVKTILAVGVDPRALIEAAKASEIIKKKQDAIAKIRQNVQPLMAQLKRLTPAQRERATELLYQADEMEQEIAGHQKKVGAALQSVTSTGHEVILQVQKVAYQGVSIVFGDMIAHLHKEYKGPFKVVRRVHERVEEILLIDKISGNIHVLGSREYDYKNAEADFGS